MLFYKNGFYVACKVKDLKERLKSLGTPETKVTTILRLHLH